MTRVSVVVPTYNRATVLPRAIDSVLEQTVDDVEVVVVDDGSTDDTESVVDGYDDERVRYIAHDDNRGANVARNTGIEAATGAYVAFLDSDDEWRPTKLVAQLDRLDGEEWIAAYCDCETRLEGVTGRLQTAVASALARADDASSTEGRSELAAEILADNVHPAAGSTLVVDRDVAERVGGFDESLDRFQDPDVVLRILDEGPIAYVDDPLVVRHDTGTPDVDVVRVADEQYLAKHADKVERAERRGYDVQGAHALVLAKRYFEAGRPISGALFLRRAAVPARHLPGLGWAAVSGLRSRDDRWLLTAAAAAFAVVAYVRATDRSESV